jgi:hypothetical protein
MVPPNACHSALRVTGHRQHLRVLWQAELLGSAIQTAIESCMAPVFFCGRACQLAYCASTHRRQHGNIVVVASSARLCASGIRRYSSVGDLEEPSLGAEVHSESNLLYLTR